MKRARTSRHARLTPRVESLVQLAESLAEASSRLEIIYWEGQLETAIDRLLADQNEEGLNAALDQLHESESGAAYDALADLIEARCETPGIAEHDVQLIAIPILAWSRFNIPSGVIPASTLEALSTQLQAHVLAADVKIALVNFMFSPDQLPQGFCATAELASTLGEAALRGQTVMADPAILPESMAFLSDSRYIIGAVAAPAGTALFRWQETDGKRSDADKHWQSQGGNNLQPLLTGCATEFLLPLPFFAACRSTDRAARPFSLQASIEFLKATLDIGAHQLRAIVAPFYEEELEEYRIGFTLSGHKDVIYGLVWPLLDQEDENSEILAQIEAHLRQHHLEDILVLEQHFPVEFCDDCGSPLYPNPDGEIVHAELPEDDVQAIPKHLH